MTAVAARAFLECIESGRYFEAHEVFELFWFPRRFEHDDEVRLLKGFINASVSFELMRRGRPQAAQRVWNTYLKYRPLLESLSGEMRPAYLKIARRLETVKRRCAGYNNPI